MSCFNRSKIFKSTFAVALIALFATHGSSAHAIFEENDPNSIYIFDAGLACKIKIQKPWQNFAAIFGFSSILYESSKTDNEKRAMLGFVITPFDEVDLTKESGEKEFEAFRKAKADYVKEEGGTFIGSAESLKGENGIYRIAVKYRLNDENVKDSSYFFLVHGRLVHAKALFAYDDFDEADIEKQILNILASIQCRE